MLEHRDKKGDTAQKLINVNETEFWIMVINYNNERSDLFSFTAFFHAHAHLTGQLTSYHRKMNLGSEIVNSCFIEIGKT